MFFFLLIRFVSFFSPFVSSYEILKKCRINYKIQHFCFRFNLANRLDVIVVSDLHRTNIKKLKWKQKQNHYLHKIKTWTLWTSKTIKLQSNRIDRNQNNVEIKNISTLDAILPPISMLISKKKKRRKRQKYWTKFLFEIFCFQYFFAISQVQKLKNPQQRTIKREKKGEKLLNLKDEK